MKHWGIIWGLTVLIITGFGAHAAYPVVDTGQDSCYNLTTAMTCPPDGSAFAGQDAQYAGTPPSYSVSADGLTVLDTVTGLRWLKSPDLNGDGEIDSEDKLTWTELQAYPDTLNSAAFGGYTDWRIPTIKELYSLMNFRGTDPSGYSGDPSGLVPFIDTDTFDFGFGDTDAGERLIDAQYWSSTEYVGTTMGGDATVFGVNFADGRIKGYPRDTGPGGQPFTQYVRLVRSGSEYGVNQFVDNGDGTVTDLATGLMWMKSDSGQGYNWENALLYAETLDYAGYTDWRLPDAKELQSIVDYSRSPSTSGTAAIDPVFNTTAITDESGGVNYPYFWSGTTHINTSDYPGTYAAYVTFGEALGWMEVPPGSGSYQLWDVHGAGAQRSDPKDGDPGDWPYGHGPQGDVIRIFNYVRAVRWTGDPPTPAPTTTPVTPTPTPTTPPGQPTYTPHPTPPAGSTGVTLIMPGAYFRSGDTCSLTAELSNPGEPVAGAALAVVLDVFGRYWFWPSWNAELDYSRRDLPTGTETLDIIAPFTWPDTGDASADGLMFIAALLTPDLSALLGDASGIGTVTFGYGP